jgi:hypothetical protein
LLIDFNNDLAEASLEFFGAGTLDPVFCVLLALTEEEHWVHPLDERSESILPMCRLVTFADQLILGDQKNHLIHDPPSSRRTKGLDRKIFAFLHFCLVLTFHEYDRLPAMYLILVDRMSTQVFNHLYWLVDSLQLE